MESNLQFDFGGHRTEVVFSAGSLSDAMREELGNPENSSGVLTVFDANTCTLASGLTEPRIVLTAGEHAKQWSGVAQVLQGAVDAGLARDGVIAGVGGGVVCDTAAFAASVYMRGCRLILVPTSLLAMADAALGGKTGVNFAGFKNMIGTFYPARRLVIVPGVVQSLSEREYKSGLAEVLKSALLDGEEFLSFVTSAREQILERDNAHVREMVLRSLTLKGRIVEEDFREEGNRAVLNLGHTFAHALESVSGFGTWTHGEAVAWGIVKAMQLGVRLGITDSRYAGTVEALFADYGFTLCVPGDHAEKLLGAMQQDKKKQAGELRFVLQAGCGETQVRRVPVEDVRAVLTG